MRGNELLDKMELVEPAYVEAADQQPRRRKSGWVMWGVAAACVCLVVVGAMTWSRSEPDSQANSGITVTEEGVTIPPLDVSLSADEAADMIAFFIYQGRCYVQYDWIYGNTDLVGEYLGTATGLIDEWTPKEGYVELAGSVRGDFYAVKGYDPSFMLCMTDTEGVVSTYVCNRGITLKYGSELYEDRLHLSGNYDAVQFESRASWYYSQGEVYQLLDGNATVAEFVAQLNAAEFLPWRAVEEEVEQTRDSIYDTELYHVYFRMNNGTTVRLRLYENGYVRFQGVMDVCVQIPEASYAPLLALLDGRDGAEPVLEDNLNN